VTTTAVRQRPRGFVENYRPRQQTLDLLNSVQAVLTEYSAQLPLTARQIFYRLVGASGYEKTERAYSRLLEALVMARRSGLIPFEAIRDDGPSIYDPNLWTDTTEWLEDCRLQAQYLRLSPWPDQPYYVEVICEAGGMAPMLAKVAQPFGITVRSGGGFDSLTAKHNLAQLYQRQGKPVVVLHVGDYDPSGEALWINLQEDVAAFCRAMGGSMSVQRVAVTPAQQQAFNLPTAPPKVKDRRSCFTDSFTVQAEALPPDLLQSIVREAIESVIDLEALEQTRLAEKEAQVEMVDAIDSLLS
jgi:hypothetical protein